MVNEVLSQKENLIKYSTETKVLKLLVDEKLSNEEKLTLVELCEKKILEIDILQGRGKLIDPIRFQKLHKKFLEHMKLVLLIKTILIEMAMVIHLLKLELELIVNHALGINFHLGMDRKELLGI